MRNPAVFATAGQSAIPSLDRRSGKAREVRVHLVEDEQDVLRREV